MLRGSDSANSGLMQNPGAKKGAASPQTVAVVGTGFANRATIQPEVAIRQQVAIRPLTCDLLHCPSISIVRHHRLDIPVVSRTMCFVNLGGPIRIGRLDAPLPREVRSSDVRGAGAPISLFSIPSSTESIFVVIGRIARARKRSVGRSV